MNIYRKFSRSMQFILASLALTCAVIAPSHAQQGRGPASEEECKRVIALAQASDKDPLTTMRSDEGRWFEKWADDVPDYQFGPDAGVFWFHNGAAKGELQRVLRFHHTVTTAAFQVQHKIFDPRKSKEDLDAKTLAGVEGLLRAYESLLAKRAENRSAELDQAIVVRNQGGLAAFVKTLPPMPTR